jgi:HEAT repeat protein
VGAAKAIAQIGPGARGAVPALHAALKEKDRKLATMAAVALGNIGAEAREAIPELCEALRSQDELQRGMAARALGQLGPDAAPAAAPLYDALLADKDAKVRRYVVYALGRIGVSARFAVIGLHELVRPDAEEQPAEVQEAVAEALQKIGEPKKDDVARLVEYLKNPSVNVRIAAAQTLFHLRGEAKDAAAGLMAVLRDDDERVRLLGSLALVAVDPQQAGAVLAPLRGLLTSADAGIRASAAEGIGNLGPDAKDAIPGLRDALLKDKEPPVREAAAIALGKMGEVAKDTVPALVGCLKDDEAGVRSAAAHALAGIGPPARSAALAPLKNMLTTEADPTVRLAVAFTLGWLDASQVSAVTLPELLKGLRHRDTVEVRIGAAQALGDFGPKANTPAVVQALTQAKRDENAEVQKAAEEALKKIQGAAKP